MLSLISETRFWTLKDEISVKDTDLGVFKYYDKKESQDSSYNQGKRNYAEGRGMTWIPPNKRPNKLKESLKELEEQLEHFKIIYCNWKNNSILQLILSSGLLINIFINIFSADIIKIIFDKYLIGKLCSENVADVIFTRSHLILTYNDNQMTIIYFTKPLMNGYIPEKLNKMEPRIKVMDLAGPSGRRIDRKLSSNVSGDLMLVWWRCTRDEVYPWSPIVKDQDRANVHIYDLLGTKAELFSYYRTEFDPLCVSFSKIHSNIIHSIEQKVSKKGEVTVESCVYEVASNRLQRTQIFSIPLQTQVCCMGLSPDETKLLLGCIDGSLLLYDQGRGVTHLVKASFISTMVCWHPDGGLVVVANERSQIQCFDLALACIKNQFLSEDMTPANLIDLASYFKHQPTLLHLHWSAKSDLTRYTEQYAQTDAVLLLYFQRGPLAAIRLIGGGCLRGDIHGSCLTADAILSQYLEYAQVDRALNLLLSLNWDAYGIQCMRSLHRIANYLFRLPLTHERELQLETALGSFHVPLRPISQSTEDQFADQVTDLTHRFFHHLLRHEKMEKAFRLAIDLADPSLFLDIECYARSINQEALAIGAREHAVQLQRRVTNSVSSTSDRSSISASTNGSEDDSATSTSCTGSTCSGCERSLRSYSPFPHIPPLPTLNSSPLQPLPNTYQSTVVKPKVKFSDRVTHFPSTLSSSANINSSGERDSNSGNPGQMRSTHLNNLQNLNNLNLSGPPDVSEEEETTTNGTIKIVHFGVV